MEASAVDQCLSENSAVELIDGAMAAPAREGAQRHLDSCDRCRRLISALAAEQFASAAPGALMHPAAGSTDTEAKPDGEALAPGATLGRYLVLDVLGAGGMGIVYAAFDPKLARKIALKRVRVPGLDPGEARARSLGERLVREARAMARLQHPNVTTVYDAGTEADELFIAMELVDGTTLRRWLVERRRTWREIIAVFASAGRGLEAAHAAGIVHRDFKPDNVLIARDGRVSVSDFGLARHVTSPEECPGELRPTDDGATNDGQLGTPAYMAPEQRLSARAADARSDEYSFCAALHEALWGSRPDGHPQPSEPRLAALGRVPRGARRVLDRGLAADPAQRFATMTALLAALSRATHRTRRAGIAAAAVAAILGVGAFWSLSSRGTDALCGGGRRELAAAWGLPSRFALGAALLGHDVPYASTTWHTVEHALDAYTDRWAAMHVEACKATAVYHTQPEPVLALRMECLEQRRQDLEQTVAELADPAMPIEKASTVAVSLPSIARCADAAALAEPVPPPLDTVTAARVAAIRQELARAKAQCEAGLYQLCATAARGLVVEARALKYAPLLAQTSYRLGIAEAHNNHVADAERALDEAILTGEAGRDDDTVANATAVQVVVVGYFAGRYDDGLRLVARAQASIARLATISPQLAHDAMGSLLAARSSLAFGHADAAQAAALDEEAIRYSEQTYGRDAPPTGRLHLNHAADLAVLGRYDEALAHYDRARAIFEATEGEAHPDLIALDLNVGKVLVTLGRNDEAALRLERAMANAERATGSKSRDEVGVLEALSSLRLAQDRPREALDLIDRALAIRARDGGGAAGHITAMVQRGAALTGLGRSRDAEGAYQDALALGERTLGPTSAALVRPLRELGVSACKARRAREATGYFERALALGLGPDASRPGTAEVELLYAACLATAGQGPRALAMARSVRAEMTNVSGGARIVAAANEVIAALSPATKASHQASDRK